jgi:acetyltransferase-like isoleucine patch superfamily enzyme
VKFTGTGKLISGDKLFIRCDKTNPVKIHIKSTADLKLGNQVFLNNGVQLSCSEKILIGNHVDIADDCLIIDNDFHSVGSCDIKSGPIIIEDDVWIASRSIILKGVTIGKGSVIGAGSIVTKSIPPYSFAAGNPAKVIRTIK